MTEPLYVGPHKEMMQAPRTSPFVDRCTFCGQLASESGHADAARDVHKPQTFHDVEDGSKSLDRRLRP